MTLPTGDRLSLGPHGTVTPLSADHADMTGFNDASGDRYLVPAEAAPYAGHQLDVSLFDLTKLAVVEANQNPATARIPVRLTYRSGFAPTAPAGVTLTAVTHAASTGSTATGYLTVDSGRALAEALRQQIAADRAAGKAAGASGLPDGLFSMALAGSTAPATPFYPLNILQIDAIDANGQPANIEVELIDTDNSQIFMSPVTVMNGVARIAVPVGHYAAYATFFQIDSQGDVVKDSFVSIQDFQVPATGPVPTQTLDARTATSRINVTTDRAAAPNLYLDAVVRTPLTGPADIVFQVAKSPTGLYVNPAPKASVGSSEFAVDWNSVAPSYQYVVAYHSDHVDANQTYAAHDADLATGTDTLAGDPAYGTSQRTLSGGLSTDAAGFLIGGGFPNGSTATTYYTPGTWSRSLLGPGYSGQGSGIIGPVLYSDPVEFARGTTVAHTSNQGPMTPGVRRHAVPDLYDSCGACAGAGGLNVTLPQVGDSNVDTTGSTVGTETDAYYWNGTPIVSNPPVPPSLGLVLGAAPAGPATVRVVVDIDRTEAGATQSTKTHTDVSFRYMGKADPAATLPAGITCLAAEAAAAVGNPSGPCQILPVLTITYRLAGLSATNTSQSRVQVLGLDIGHESFGGRGPRAAVTSAQASLSTDGGATWHDVPTLGAFGHYVALWPNPAAGTSLTLRVTAKDAVGGTIEQTVTNPYTVG
ncbi:hypothetical protein [Catenulispora sp. GAS73]|uniref:hypothetical protein n=1 Tax=Catenulispora sp. GAS73 TaxID=3156269 RepID=UPI0035118563